MTALGLRDVSTLWLETVLIGDIVNCINLTIISSEGIRSTDDECFLFSSLVLQLCLFWTWNSIAGFIAIKINLGQQVAQQFLIFSFFLIVQTFLPSTKNCSIIWDEFLRKVITAKSDVIVLVTKDLCVLWTFQRSCEADSDDGSKCNEEFHDDKKFAVFI